MTSPRKKCICPFCEGEGCCFCDHEGKIFVGENELIKSEESLNSIGVKYLKETNPGEIWYEMWEHFLDEKNVPNDFKLKNQNFEKAISKIQEEINMSNNENALRRADIICRDNSYLIDEDEVKQIIDEWQKDKDKLAELEIATASLYQAVLEFLESDKISKLIKTLSKK